MCFKRNRIKLKEREIKNLKGGCGKHPPLYGLGLSIVEIQIVYKQSSSRNNAKKINKDENRTALLVVIPFENNRT